MNGADMIAAERRRQRAQEGYDWRHDDEHDEGELAIVGAIYALPLEIRERPIWNAPLRALLWPRMWGTFKGVVYTQATKQPTESRIRELTKAGALIAAEIDRLQRAQKRAQKR